MASGAQQISIFDEELFIGRTVGIMAERAVLQHKFFVSKFFIYDISFMAAFSEAEKQCFWRTPFISGYGMTCLTLFFT